MKTLQIIFFQKKSSQKPVKISESQDFVPGFTQVEDLYQVLSSVSKMKPEVNPKKKDSEENKKSKTMKGLTQQEINENLNRLMNM